MAEPVVQSPTTDLLTAPVTGRKWLTAAAFEMRFERPAGFDFVAGQKVKLVTGRIYRHYSLINSPRDWELAICVRHIPQGKMTPAPANARIGQLFHLSAAFGLNFTSAAILLMTPS
jgi:ferredoxin-NADP reductase